MTQKIYAGRSVDVNEEGYLANPSQWTKDIAFEIAKEEGIHLTVLHYVIIEYLRARYNSGSTISIRSIHNSGVIDLKTFYQLFPGAPLRKACRIGGIPKPESCV